MARVTSWDVAREAGVSQSTVSRALSGDARISDQTRKRIRKTVERLGYTPNGHARNLQTQKSNMVGLIMADINNPFYPAVLDLCTQRVRAMGKQRTRELGKQLRLTEPLVRENGELRPATWEEALDRAAAGFARARENDATKTFGVFSCSKASNEMNYAAAKFTRAAMRTNNIDSCNRT